MWRSMRCAAAPATLHLRRASSRRAGSSVQDRHGDQPTGRRGGHLHLAATGRSGHVQHVPAVLERSGEPVRRVPGPRTARPGRTLRPPSRRPPGRPAWPTPARSRPLRSPPSPRIAENPWEGCPRSGPSRCRSESTWPAPAEATALAAATSVAAGSTGRRSSSSIRGRPSRRLARSRRRRGRRSARTRRGVGARASRPSYPGRRRGPPDMNGPRSLRATGSSARNGWPTLVGRHGRQVRRPCRR